MFSFGQFDPSTSIGGWLIWWQRLLTNDIMLDLALKELKYVSHFCCILYFSTTFNTKAILLSKMTLTVLTFSNYFNLLQYWTLQIHETFFIGSLPFHWYDEPFLEKLGFLWLADAKDITTHSIGRRVVASSPANKKKGYAWDFVQLLFTPFVVSELFPKLDNREAD